MNTQLQAEKAERLRALHQGPKILVLPNAWDVASARVIEEMGYPAIATSSAAIAATLGYPDGQRISRNEMLEVVGRIARAVRVPVTADAESGYGTTPQDAAQFAKDLLATGAVGLNFEDITGDTESSHVELGAQIARIEALRDTAKSLGVPLVINARTDIFLMPIGPAETRLERTIDRLRAYRGAGADCVFVPGVADRDIIAKLVQAIDAPLNILTSPTCPPIPELERLGVRRVSLGSSLMRATLGLVRRIGKELQASGTYATLSEGAVSFPELQRLLNRANS
jgi:2-methylisocitrate lyase-like PEP mutase family enzyme